MENNQINSIRAGPEIVGTLVVVALLYILFEIAEADILVLPGYIILWGYELIENTLFYWIGGIWHYVGIWIYLVVLSVLVGLVIHRVRTR